MRTTNLSTITVETTPAPRRASGGGDGGGSGNCGCSGGCAGGGR